MGMNFFYLSFYLSSEFQYMKLYNDLSGKKKKRNKSCCYYHVISFHVLFRDLTNPADPIPGVLRIPNVSLTIDLSNLDLDRPCEPVRDHNLVKDKFQDVVMKWFRPVPTNPEYYYYCPETMEVSYILLHSLFKAALSFPIN